MPSGRRRRGAGGGRGSSAGRGSGVGGGSGRGGGGGGGAGRGDYDQQRQAAEAMCDAASRLGFNCTISTSDTAAPLRLYTCSRSLCILGFALVVVSNGGCRCCSQTMDRTFCCRLRLIFSWRATVATSAASRVRFSDLSISASVLACSFFGGGVFR